jgi:hypothetical protein
MRDEHEYNHTSRKYKQGICEWILPAPMLSRLPDQLRSCRKASTASRAQRWLGSRSGLWQANPFVDIARTHNPHREVIEIALRIDGTRQPVLTQHLGAVFTTAGPATAINRDTKQGGMPLHTMLLCSVHVDRSAINDPNWLSADPSTYSRRISVRTTRATAV